MKFSFNQPLVSTVVFLATCGFFLIGNAKPAHADPHAMFYTVSGQQQLFFNMLAALDQADYVETATRGEGQPTNSSRKELVDNRAQAGLSAEKNTVLEATKTSLNNVLTRSITLEGQDLWTTYMRFQLALEAQRRKDTASVLIFFCERVLGLKDCQENQESPRLALARKQLSHETRALEEVFGADQEGIDVLYSGTAADQAQRRAILNGTSLNPVRDKAYNAFVSQVYKQAADNPREQAYLAGLVGGVAYNSIGEPNAGVFDGITVTEDTVELTDSNATVEDYLGKLSGIFNLTNQFQEAKMAAQSRRVALTEQTTVDGAKADTFAIPHITNGELGEIEAGIRVPASLKAAQAQQVAGVLGQLANNPMFRGSQASVPGQTKILNNNQGQAAGISSDGLVAGLTTSGSQGQVLAETSNESIDDLDQGEPLTPPGVQNVDAATNIAGPLDESSIQVLLQQLLGGSNRGGCQDSCSRDGLGDLLDNVADDL